MAKTDRKVDKRSQTRDKSLESIQMAKSIASNYPSLLQLGSLKLKETQTTAIKPFMRCVHNINIEDCVHQVFHKHWKINEPTIAVIIISDVGPLKEWTNELQIKLFQKGLMKAADNTNMWLITNALNIGVSSIVGEAVRNEFLEMKRSRIRDSTLEISKLNFIGIADENLLRCGETITKSEEYEIQISNLSSISGEDKYDLNSNLTHYLFIRDDTINKSGVNAFLINFMSFLRSGEQRKSSDISTKPEDICSLSDHEIPVVSIVIQGGFENSHIVLQQIKNGIPVIVLGGSGGLADLLAFVEYELREQCLEVWDYEFVESYIKPELTLKIVKRFPHLRDNSFLCNTFRNRILDCVRESRRDGQIFLTVINLFNSYSSDVQNLSEYLLLALFKSRSPEQMNRADSDVSPVKSIPSSINSKIVSRDIDLCIDWNCPELAKKEVINKDPNFGRNLNKKQFEEALIRSNRCDFIDIFLSHGFRLRTFVSPKRLKRMYRTIHSNDFFRIVCWEGILGLSSDIKQTNKLIDRELNLLMNSCTGLLNFFDESELELFVLENFPRTEAEAERKALAIVVIWALFHFRKRLVQILWKQSDQPIYLAIIIASIYDRLSSYVTDGGLKEELQNESKLYTTYAYNILDICYKDSAERAIEALNESSIEWNYRSAVDIAAYARLLTFFSHPCCQKWLTVTFNGNIRVREVRWGFLPIPIFFKITMSAFLVFPMYFWIRFSQNTYRVKEESIERYDLEEENQSLPAIESNQQKKPKDSDLDRKYFDTGFANTGNDLIIRNQPPPWVMISELWNAPITKFWISQLFHIIYLAIFSLAILYPKCGNYYLDFIVCFWTSLITVDLIRSSYVFHMKYTNLPIGSKVVEIVSQILFIMVYVSERLLYHQTFNFLTSYHLKVILCLNLLYAYYTLLSVYLPISATLGPLLYKIKIMVILDFTNFMRITVLAMTSFGICIQALLYPDLVFSGEMARVTFHRAFFSLFLTPADELVPNSKQGCDYRTLRNVSETHDVCLLSKYTEPLCPNTGFWPYIMWISYLIFLKLILMTLLYAIFANSASRLAADNDCIWKFQRYILVKDFVNRLTLPPPLNFIYYLYIMFRWISHKPNKDKPFSLANNVIFSDPSEIVNRVKLLSEDDYSYFKGIASDYYEEQENKFNNETIIKRLWERMQANSEEIEYEKNILKQLKGKLFESERALRQSLTYLETIKHLTNRKYGMEYQIKSSKLHVLSRHSPYPHTSVRRFPVPDKYVSWDVMFIAYDPIAYTKPKHEFHISLQQFVDEDLLLLQVKQMQESKHTLPVFEWNTIIINAAGITINRQSWQMSDDNESPIVYKLENGIPVNPFGRTGLRGRGSLLRWGPNHHLMVVITRSLANELQVVIEKTDVKQNCISLLTKFIESEMTYTYIESYFKNIETNLKNWNNCEKMIEFFKACDVLNDEMPSEPTSEPTVLQSGLKYERLLKGYFDDPLNTDQTWKELELWHFHYTQKDILNNYMTDNIDWREVTEDLFAKLSLSHSAIVQDVVNKLKAVDQI